MPLPIRDILIPCWKMRNAFKFNSKKTEDDNYHYDYKFTLAMLYQVQAQYIKKQIHTKLEFIFLYCPVITCQWKKMKKRLLKIAEFIYSIRSL